jgi:hypothetical protein
MVKDVTQSSMRNVFLVFLLLTTGFVTAQTDFARESEVTILLNDIALGEALTILSISYGVQFSYSDDVVPTDAIISLDIKHESLTSTLDKLLSPFGISYKIVKGNHIILRKISPVLTQTIRGTIKDFVTNTPLPGAIVLIKDSKPLTGTTTDGTGKFRIDHANLGRITLVVSNVGYDTRELSDLLLGKGKELVLDIALSESVTQMDELTITGLKNDGIPGEGLAVTSSNTFSVEDTKRYAGSMGDPARMATAFAGVSSGSDDSNALVVRGNSPRGVLWRIDGIEVPNPNHFATEGASSGIVSVLSPNMVGNSDILTGAFPAQYGNALSAVFDISLRNGNNEKQEHSLQTGILGVEASTEGPFTKQHPSSYLINYRYSTLSVLDKLGFDLNEAGQYKDYQDVGFKINFPSSYRGTFSLFGIGGKSKSNRADSSVLDNNFSEIGILGLSYKDRLNENTILNASVSYSGTRISKSKEVAGLNDGLFAQTERYTKSYIRALFSMRKKITNHFYTEAGVIMTQLNYNFFLRTVNPGDSTYAVVINFNENDKGKTYIAQGFLYARQYFSPSLFGFYGFHFIRFGLTSDYAIEPRTGLRWQMSQGKSLSLAYGKHSRIENLQYYLARDHQAGANEIQINKNLGFTRADHVVLSYEQTLPAKHRLKSELYFQKLYNAPVETGPESIYTTLNEDTGFITDSLINNGRGKNYGLEISVEKSFSNSIYYLINGSFFRSTFSVDELVHNTAYNSNYSIHLLSGKEFEMGRQHNRIGMNIKMTQTGGRRYIPIDLEKSIAEKRQVHKWDEAFDHQMSDYFRIDFQLVYKINRPSYSLEWRLDIQNLTNRRNAGWYYYVPSAETIELKKQIGIIPLLSCRIDF